MHAIHSAPTLTPESRPAGDEASEVVGPALAALAQAERRVSFVYEVEARRLRSLDGPCEELLGITEAELQRDPLAWRRGLDPAEVGELDPLGRDAAEPGPVRRTWRARRADGRGRTLTVTLVRRMWAGREVMAGSVTEAAPAEDAAAVEAFRQAVERAHEGLAVTDAQGCYRYLNREHVRLFGYGSEAELIGRSWKIFYGEASIEFIETTVFPQLAAQGHWSGRLLAKRRDGSEFHEGLTLSLLPDGGIVCNCQDVSAEVELSARLERSETMFRTFLNTLPTAVTIRNLTGNYEFVNVATTNFLGREVSDRGVRRDMSVCLSDEKEFIYWAAVDQRVARTGERVKFDFPIFWGGRDWVLEVEKLPLRINDTEVTHVCTLINDVTTQRRLEQAAAETARQREEFAVMQREFISMVSHEFRTPLTAIQGVHYLLEKKFTVTEGDLAADARRLLGMQQRAQDTLKELVDQVLLLNRLDHVSADTGQEPTELAQFFADAVDRLNVPLEHSRIRLRSELPAGFRARINPAHLRAALENLVSNGLKYSPAKTAVTVTVGLADGRWTLTVADQGRGIPREDQDKLFRPFYRARNVGTVPGTGLGLTIVRRVVDYHHGTITCESSSDAGTTFRLAFPPEGAPPEAAGDEARASGTRLPFAKLRPDP